MEHFKISTLNVNGLGDIDKRRDVFGWLRDKKHDIYFLQETHLKSDSYKYNRSLWGCNLWIAGNESNKNGVAILFSSRFEYKVHKVIKDPNGCFLIMDVELLQKRVSLINIYGPSSGDHPEFYDKILQYIVEINNDINIISGDWNCVLSTLLDARNYSSNSRPRTRAKIINLMSELNLSDVYRELYPEKKAYTWRKFNGTKQGRLDYFLISTELMGEVQNITISPGYRTDHSLVTLYLKKEEFKRDRPFWKFNNAHLKDSKYLDEIKKSYHRNYS